MNGTRIAGLILVIAGIAASAIGSFSFTKETHEAQVGPLSLSVKEKETVNIPMWAGIAAVVIGGGLLLVGGRRA
ncbi:hypothetical protein EC845_0939 [Comamonas sp. BIGb0124]|jgi:hypothetical protein|uniref:hypothetical protein n=1 Tax=Comamonas sp. BIGb0124 TaxID=2485130 RepID=UPI000F47F506|nr:hypothetical protein [Comamonas sp. BIGb0124]ROR24905.1 hypothetical protein EC845_0939 [Comamonas sp. BIGb0124]